MDGYAVYKRDGALCALPVDEAADLRLIQASKKFRSIGRALVAKQELERQSKSEAI